MGSGTTRIIANEESTAPKMNVPRRSCGNWMRDVIPMKKSTVARMMVLVQ
jgi:hypothetical protein